MDRKAGNDPGPGPAGLTQARQATIDRLCERFAEDGLSMKDFEHRLDLAHRATTTRQLASLVADFPPTPALDVGGGRSAPAPDAGAGPVPAAPAGPVGPTVPANVVPPERVPARQFLAGVLGAGTRSGVWIAPRAINAVALMGGVELDFREAGFGPGVTEVTVFALWGGVDVVVPPGLQVECNGAGILGGFVREPDELADASTASSDPGSPVLRVNGVALMGGVTISTRLPGEREKDAARRRKLARKARLKELKARRRELRGR